MINYPKPSICPAIVFYGGPLISVARFARVSAACTQFLQGVIDFLEFAFWRCNLACVHAYQIIILVAVKIFKMHKICNKIKKMARGIEGCHFPVRQLTC
jgi:hypothetical protein